MGIKKKKKKKEKGKKKGKRKKQKPTILITSLTTLNAAALGDVVHGSRRARGLWAGPIRYLNRSRQGGHPGGSRSDHALLETKTRRLVTVLELYSLGAGAGVALVTAQALHAPPLVRVAHAAAAPVQVAREIVCALDVHVDLFCGDETDRGEGPLWERQARLRGLAAEGSGAGSCRSHPLPSLSRGPLGPALPGRGGRGDAHPCPSRSARRRRWSRCCPSVSSRCPASPAASSGAAALAAAGRFGEWLFCHNLQVSAGRRGKLLKGVGRFHNR